MICLPAALGCGKPVIGGGGGGEITGITWSQSSAYSGLVANATNMRDANPDGGPCTGAATNNGGTEWVKADLGAAHSIIKVTVGGGYLPGWGPVALYLNGSILEYSTDDSTWNSAGVTFSGVTNTGTLDKDFTVGGFSARYWRIKTAGWLSIATFRLYD